MRKDENTGSTMTATDLIEKAKTEFCMEFCKYADECDRKIEADEKLRQCPLDRL